MLEEEQGRDDGDGKPKDLRSRTLFASEDGT